MDNEDEDMNMEVDETEGRPADGVFLRTTAMP